ncbi:MAG: type II secretion system protein, partial [Acidobacteria bacterium]|nr:type II secretion system protein [Acidobacteriota bacterium]
MNRKRHSRAGFTLTEILMATGILGVGLTMVASVFPVAVDQSRRSRDATMAAMCARSMAAYMRANRSEVLKWCRVNAKSKTTLMGPSAVPYAIRMYNPVSFLYDVSKDGTTKVRRKYNPEAPDYGPWAQGN